MDIPAREDHWLSRDGRSLRAGLWGACQVDPRAFYKESVRGQRGTSREKRVAAPGPAGIHLTTSVQGCQTFSPRTCILGHGLPSIRHERILTLMMGPC